MRNTCFGARCVKSIDTLISIASFLSNLLLGFLITILSFEVVMRYIFNRPTGFADELCGYFLAGLVMLGISHTLRINGHVRVEILFGRFPDKLKRWISHLMNLISIIPMCILIWLSVKLIVQYYVTNRLSFASILQVPMWIPLTIVPIGLFLLVLTIIGEFYKFLHKLPDTE